MKRLVLVLCLLSFGTVPTQAKARKVVARPPILGIAHVRLHVADLNGSAEFYKGILRMTPVSSGCEAKNLRCFWVGGKQSVQLDSDPIQSGNLVEEIAFLTADLKGMHKFLSSRGLEPDRIVTGRDGMYFGLKGPEGHRIVFVQGAKGMYVLAADPRISRSIIHAGMVVRDRTAEDHFFKDILGFRPYWHGGMKEDKDDWVALQVPDGTDWVEYMLNVSQTPDKHTLGVMNHIALGVTDIQAANAALLSDGWKPSEEPKLGRDGKWQLNVYDPDDTRIEFMEFTPKEKPCCSEFTGPHPKP